MPSNEAHRFISEGIRKLLEQLNPQLLSLIGEQGDTHKNMDIGAKEPFLHFNKNGVMKYAPLGPNHREVGHDPISLGLLSIFGKVNPLDAGLHLLTDGIWSGLKDFVFNRNQKNNKK